MNAKTSNSSVIFRGDLMDRLHLTDLIEQKVLQQIQDEFSRFTGMAALTADADGVPVTKGSGFTTFCMELIRSSELGRRRCFECDRKGAMQTLKDGKPSVYSCHAGLIDFAAPIMVNGRMIGSFIGGQVRNETLDVKYMTQKAKEMGIEPEAYIAEAKKANVLSKQEVEKAASFLTVIAETLSRMAYYNYEALQKNRKISETSHAQSQFITQMAMNMKDDMVHWTEQIRDFSEKADVDGQQFKECVNQVLVQSAEVKSAMDSAMNYMHMAEGKMELAESEYHIRNLMHVVVFSVYDLAEKKNVKLEVDVQDDVPDCMLGDSGRIGQVLTQILQQSIRRMEYGLLHITVSCQREEYAVMLEIKIEEKPAGDSRSREQDGIEELISQFEEQTDYMEDVEGTGMVYVQNQIHAMSGSIQCAEEDDKVNAFLIQIPQLEIKEESVHGI